MNTINKAREVSKQYPELNMANYTVDDVSELNAWGLQAANTIDALIAELKRVQENYLLLQGARERWIDSCLARTAERDKALTVLAALKGQEPVGSVTSSPWRGLENIEWQQSGDIPEGTHMLYLAAGAQQNIIWNRKIRDSVDSLLDQAGYAKDSSARHQLSLMNFDAAGAQQFGREAHFTTMQERDAVRYVRPTSKRNISAETGEILETA